MVAQAIFYKFYVLLDASILFKEHLCMLDILKDPSQRKLVFRLLDDVPGVMEEAIDIFAFPEIFRELQAIQEDVAKL